MEKKKTKAESNEKSNASAKKKIEKKAQKQTPIAKKAIKNEIDYPLWTMPEHLNDKDCKDLKRVFELYKEGKFELALNFASELDTFVRDEIPSDIWIEIGGTLTPKGGEELVNNEEKQERVEKTEDVNLQQKETSKSLIRFQNPYLLKEGELLALTQEYFIGNPQVNEAKFHTKNNLDEFIIQYHKTLFGESTVIIDNTKSMDEYFPNVFLVDFNDKEKPRLYIIETNLSEDNLGILYARITHFIASIKNKAYQNDFLVELNHVINANDETKANTKPLTSS